MISFLEFIENQKSSKKENLIVLDDFICSYTGVTRNMRYKIPFYDYGKWICYLNPLKKKNSIELVFLDGKLLSQTFPMLNRKKRKMVAGIEIEHIDSNMITQIDKIIRYIIDEK